MLEFFVGNTSNFTQFVDRVADPAKTTREGHVVLEADLDCLFTDLTCHNIEFPFSLVVVTRMIFRYHRWLLF